MSIISLWDIRRKPLGISSIINLKKILMATNSAVMGRFALSQRLNIIGWLVTAIMLVSTGGLFVTWGK
jgi:Mn2+/Fe2+ NRAMP family transporter